MKAQAWKVRILLAVPVFSEGVRLHFFRLVSSTDQSTGLRSRGLHVRIVCEAPSIPGLRAALVTAADCNSVLLRDTTGFDSLAAHQIHAGLAEWSRQRPSKPIRRVRFSRSAPLSMHGAGAIGSAAASKAEGSRFDSVAPCQCVFSAVAKWSKAPVCKSGSRRGFESRPRFQDHVTNQVPLAQWTRAVGF